ncbi:MAG: hypothetical protein ACREMY_02195, partial [bacterium]
QSQVKIDLLSFSMELRARSLAHLRLLMAGTSPGSPAEVASGRAERVIACSPSREPKVATVGRSCPPDCW